MKKAVQLPQYSDTHPFSAPDGVQMVSIDKATNLPSDSSCPGDTYTSAFLEGTVPMETCSHSSTDHRNVFQKIFGLGEKKP
jgi:penicillin-binding protein 1B